MTQTLRVLGQVGRDSVLSKESGFSGSIWGGLTSETRLSRFVRSLDLECEEAGHHPEVSAGQMSANPLDLTGPLGGACNLRLWSLGVRLARQWLN